MFTKSKYDLDAIEISKVLSLTLLISARSLPTKMIWVFNYVKEHQKFSTEV